VNALPAPEKRLAAMELELSMLNVMLKTEGAAAVSPEFLM
jgi:hypothetical protein